MRSHLMVGVLSGIMIPYGCGSCIKMFEQCYMTFSLCFNTVVTAYLRDEFENILSPINYSRLDCPSGSVVPNFPRGMTIICFS
jgi:hypothetical protein